MMPSTPGSSLTGGSTDMTGDATRSASTNRTSSLTGESIIGLAVNTAKASPSVALAIRIVRSFSARLTASDHAAKAVSTRRFVSASSLSSCRRGPVPMQSLASVSTIPLA